MTKPLQDLILGAEFQAGVAAAVAEAVRQADAAGLPKANPNADTRAENPAALSAAGH